MSPMLTVLQHSLHFRYPPSAWKLLPVFSRTKPGNIRPTCILSSRLCFTLLPTQVISFKAMTLNTISMTPKFVSSLEISNEFQLCIF